MKACSRAGFKNWNQNSVLKVPHSKPKIPKEGKAQCAAAHALKIAAYS
jgi:hypothetical protein